ncbi:hypothetical protein Cob_v000101 [Colletotrichum orbiculare MAFF 240422]|uniref:Uncharacterized protein n=1 Tax=Colletotrichum orbiculare (strain 104-T / ATCC 96160 / CBS 514.97 / LARS 414 / MAFF 240422) TaxID=1213857 RepID=A0A484G8X5_COLOR|nr:hypothetical protein Cob_v000101 [Colletotrichum orbiculare MAFF 240422]
MNHSSLLAADLAGSAQVRLLDSSLSRPSYRAKLPVAKSRAANTHSDSLEVFGTSIAAREAQRPLIPIKHCTDATRLSHEVTVTLGKEGNGRR